MHGMAIPASVRAIGRAGAGTNNIPVKAMSARGVPVFNAPGANANAVKELVLAGMLMAARNIAPALQFVAGWTWPRPTWTSTVEDGKKAFAGYELAGQTLGIVGLGKIGCLVADAAIKLGMQVLGFDPDITVDAAWSLPSQVQARRQRQRGAAQRALRDPARAAGGRHAPPGERRQHRPDAAGAVLLNFSRDGVVSNTAVLDALGSGRLAHYVSDFPSPSWPASPRGGAAPPGRQHARGRRELRRDGGGPAARLPGDTATSQRGELPQRAMARESPTAWPSPTATCPTCWGRSPPPWPTPA
jgi:D-3-phosphoglycerate dehydrogenase